MARVARWPVVATLVVALSGCGGGAKTSTTASTGITVAGVRVLKTYVVHESEYRLVPRRIMVGRLGYYGFEVVNDGSVDHALALEGSGVHQRTAVLSPGGSAKFAVLFRKAGTYRLFCPVDGHRAKGMQATVVVP